MSFVAAMLLMQLSPGAATEDAARPEPFPDVFEEADRAEDPAARAATVAFASCVADRSPERVRDLLMRDFTKAAYRNSMRNLARANEDCFKITGGRGRLGMAELSLAAALAEDLIARDERPLNVRLASAAAGKDAPTYSPSDKAAMCVAKSTPDDVAKLFAAPIASDAEIQAAAVLMPVLATCARLVGSAPIETDAFGLRSIVATAVYRLLSVQES